jgi:hypothetical protein
MSHGGDRVRRRAGEEREPATRERQCQHRAARQAAAPYAWKVPWEKLNTT